MECFDAIVLGAGGLGSAAFYHIARSGLRVLALDRFPQAHAQGSSHGQTRIIRQAYFEHPNYVPLLLRAYELWRELEAATQQSLLVQTGLLEVGPADGVLIPGVLESVRQHGLPIQRLRAAEARREFPFHIPDSMEAIVELTGGYLHVEACVQSHLDQGQRHGGVWRQEKVLDWQSIGDGIQVETETSKYQAARLIVCGGAWAGQLLPDLGIAWRVLEKHQYWYEPNADSAQPANLPVYFFETPEGDYYGFPPLGELGFKVAQHSRGREHDSPFDVTTAECEEDLRQVEAFTKKHIRFPLGDLKARKACMYTMSPDGHFVIDRHPRHPEVVFAAGLSGHGFKFASVLGSLLAQLALGDPLDLDMSFLGMGRFPRAESE